MCEKLSMYWNLIILLWLSHVPSHLLSHDYYMYCHTGHQVRSESLTEMYAQVLLTGCRWVPYELYTCNCVITCTCKYMYIYKCNSIILCRCVELDCWPRSDFDDIIITHGNTLCTKVPFKVCCKTTHIYMYIHLYMYLCTHNSNRTIYMYTFCGKCVFIIMDILLFAIHIFVGILFVNHLQLFILSDFDFWA